MKHACGITVGVFDLFHVGHLNLLERCKARCERLVVAVCDDDYVRAVKHVEPVFPLEERMRILRALRCVDEVVSATAAETTDKFRLREKCPFDVLFSGDDWKGSERYRQTEVAFAAVGIAVEYLPYTHGVSTRAIKARLFGDSNGIAP